jgi:hypothetical protein
MTDLLKLDRYSLEVHDIVHSTCNVTTVSKSKSVTGAFVRVAGPGPTVTTGASVALGVTVSPARRAVVVLIVPAIVVTVVAVVVVGIRLMIRINCVAHFEHSASDGPEQPSVHSSEQSAHCGPMVELTVDRIKYCVV